MNGHFSLSRAGILLFSLVLATTFGTSKRSKPALASLSIPASRKLSPPADGKPIEVAFVLGDS